MLTIAIHFFTVVLNELLQTQKDVYVTYEYLDSDNFFMTISNCPSNNSNITIEMNNLQNMLSQFQNIAGITVTLDIDVNICAFILYVIMIRV